MFMHGKRVKMIMSLLWHIAFWPLLDLTFTFAFMGFFLCPPVKNVKYLRSVSWRNICKCQQNMAGLFIALCVIQVQSGDNDGMETSRWRKEKGRGLQFSASDIYVA